jgi:glycosyltransferase involved in cell wall biosynthesis
MNEDAPISAILAIAGNDAERRRNFLQIIRCLMEQSYRNKEIVVVEQSLDGCFYWETLGTHVEIIYKQVRWTPFNLSWCYNVGARLSSGRLLVFLGGDVLIGSDYLGLVAETVKSEYSCGWNRALYLNDRGVGMVSECYRSDIESRGYESVRTPEDGSGWGLSTIFRRGFFFETLGGFNETYESWGGEDTDIHIRANHATNTDDQLDYTILHLPHKTRLACYENKDRILTLTCEDPLGVSKKLRNANIGQPTKPCPINGATDA